MIRNFIRYAFFILSFTVRPRVFGRNFHLNRHTFLIMAVTVQAGATQAIFGFFSLTGHKHSPRTATAASGMSPAFADHFEETRLPGTETLVVLVLY